MSRRVLWRRRRVRRRESSFSRAGESLFAGYKLELGEFICGEHLYSAIVGAQFQKESVEEKPSRQRAQRRVEKIGRRMWETRELQLMAEH
jgi:hypothetical protein